MRGARARTERRRAVRGVRGAALRLALGATVALAASVAVVPARAEDVSPPTQTPGLQLSDKPPIGCCCIAEHSPPAADDCDFNLREEKCRSAGKLFADRITTWTPGKCPAR